MHNRSLGVHLNVYLHRNRILKISTKNTESSILPSTSTSSPSVEHSSTASWISSTLTLSLSIFSSIFSGGGLLYTSVMMVGKYPSCSHFRRILKKRYSYIIRGRRLDQCVRIGRRFLDDSSSLEESSILDTANVAINRIVSKIENGYSHETYIAGLLNQIPDFLEALRHVFL